MQYKVPPPFNVPGVLLDLIYTAAMKVWCNSRRRWWALSQDPCGQYLPRCLRDASTEQPQPYERISKWDKHYPKFREVADVEIEQLLQAARQKYRRKLRFDLWKAEEGQRARFESIERKLDDLHESTFNDLHESTRAKVEENCVALSRIEAAMHRMQQQLGELMHRMQQQLGVRAAQPAALAAPAMAVPSLSEPHTSALYPQQVESPAKRTAQTGGRGDEAASSPPTTPSRPMPDLRSLSRAPSAAQEAPLWASAEVDLHPSSTACRSHKGCAGTVLTSEDGMRVTFHL